MSFFTSSTSSSSSSSSYADHPFSYSVRRPSALSRFGTTVLDAILPSTSRRHNANHASLHDQALTAQPPVLKRSAITRQRQGRPATTTTTTSSHWSSIAQELMVHVALVVAAGFVTRYVVTSLWHFRSTHQTIPKTDNNNDDDDNDDESS